LVWGARTLAGNDNEWRYVSVRRFFNMVEESVKKSTYWRYLSRMMQYLGQSPRHDRNYLTQKCVKARWLVHRPKKPSLCELGWGDDECTGFLEDA